MPKYTNRFGNQTHLTHIFKLGQISIKLKFYKIVNTPNRRLLHY